MPSPNPGTANVFFERYHFSGTANNGQVLSVDDARQNGANIAYTYDALKRLTAASASAWNQAIAYDGFGNITSKSVPSGSSEPVFPGAVSSKNWLAGVSYDANGNALAVNAFALTYDMENRLTTATSGTAVESYYYDEANHRVEKTMGSNDYLYFYGPSGKLLSIRSVAANGVTSVVADRVYFGGMLLGSAGASGYSDVSTLTDRLGTAGYPYGTDLNGSAAGNDQPDFATYTKDGTTGFEYAINRYYSAGMGRFLTADPSLRNVSVGYPMTWNAFAYGNGDPLNQTDQSGLDSTICTYTPAAYEPFHCAVVPDGTNTPTPDGTSVVAITNAESVTVNGDQDYVNPYDASNSNPDTAPTGGPGGQSGGGTSNGGTIVQNCTASAQSAMNAQPSVTPTSQNLVDGVGGAVIGLTIGGWGLPEDAPLLPLVGKAGWGFVSGLLRRGVVHSVQKGLVFLTTYHSCLAAAGYGSPYNPYAPS